MLDSSSWADTSSTIEVLHRSTHIFSKSNVLSTHPQQWWLWGWLWELTKENTMFTSMSTIKKQANTLHAIVM